MSLSLTPAAFKPSITSSINSLDEFARGFPTGFILIPTTSPGSKNERQASTASSAPVSSRMPRSTVALIDGAVLDSCTDHPRVADLDDPAGVRPGDPELAWECAGIGCRLRLLGRDVERCRQRGERRHPRGNDDDRDHTESNAGTWADPPESKDRKRGKARPGNSLDCRWRVGNGQGRFRGSTRCSLGVRLDFWG